MLENLELRHLVTFRAVVEAGTFAKAAARLDYTQSAVSQQIAVLERMVGAALFDRPGGPKAPVLTLAGRLLVEHGQEIESRIEALGTALVDLSEGRSGRLRVGTFQSVSARIVPEVVALMAAKAPDVTIELVEETAEVPMLDRLASGELDIAFLVGAYPSLEQQLLLEDRYVIITRADKASNASTIPLGEVIAEPLLGMPADDTCSMFLEAGLEELGVQAKWVFRSADNGTIQSMARSGLGRGVLPQLAVDLSDTAVRFQSSDPPLPTRTIYLSRAKSRTVSPVEELFWESAVTVVADVVAEWD